MNFLQFKKILEQEHKEYKSIPFWSWNNELEVDELLRQIDDMKSVGVGGFIMHARTGLKTDYLGEKWFSCIDACLKKAKELGLDAWIYDENGWPSGFVGGKLLENNEFRAQFLEYRVKDYFDLTAFAVYKKVGNEFVLIDGESAGVKEYHSVYLRTSPSNTDILNPDVVSAFINETHERYYERFKDSFGRELAGFFTDEPQFYTGATPYSKCVAKEFEKQGKNVKDGLIYLFYDDENGYAFRTEYYQTVNRLYTENYYKRLYEWCERHGCKLTGHSCEESGLAHQMSASAGVMRSYEFEHIPAIDWLGKYLPNELITRQVSSMASQFGKKNVLTETFACCGYNATPRELRSVAEFQLFGGVNKICQHLYPYSLSSQGKFDHPPFFGKQSNWFEEFAVFNKYFEDLGFIVGETEEIYDLAIIHPLRSVYTDYIRKEHILSVKKEDDDLAELLDFLAVNGITYHFIDEVVLKNYGKAEDDALIVGNCKYNTVIVPKMRSIMSSTVEILKKYNGRLLNLSEIEFVDGYRKTAKIKSNTSFDEIIKSRKVAVKGLKGRPSVTARKGELGEFIFVKNLSYDKPCEIMLENADSYRVLDLVNMQLLAAQNVTEIEENGSIIFIKSEEPVESVSITEERDITENFSVKDITENYLVIDKARYSLDGEHYSEEKQIQYIFDRLLYDDYKGKLFIKYSFTVKDVVDLCLVVEKAAYTDFMVNGQKIEFKQSDFDLMFSECDLTGITVKGVNEIVYSIDFYEHDGVRFALFDPMAKESLRNCLYYDTSIENVYIKGDFLLDENYAIRKRTLPDKISGIDKQGFPFFTGRCVFYGRYDYDGKGRRKLSLKGDYLVAKIKANGKTADIIMADKTDITDLLTVGDNVIEISVKVSLRNLLGPLHYDQNGIFPSCFTFRTQWQNGVPKDYKEKYVLSPIGIDSVKIYSEL